MGIALGFLALGRWRPAPTLLARRPGAPGAFALPRSRAAQQREITATKKQLDETGPSKHGSDDEGQASGHSG